MKIGTVTILRAHKFTKIGTLFVTVFALDVPGSSYFVSKWVISLKIPRENIEVFNPTFQPFTNFPGYPPSSCLFQFLPYLRFAGQLLYAVDSQDVEVKERKKLPR